MEMWTLPGGLYAHRAGLAKAALEEDIRNGSHRGCFGAFSLCFFGFVSGAAATGSNNHISHKGFAVNENTRTDTSQYR